jgi:uncharacterized membrane protein
MRFLRSIFLCLFVAALGLATVRVAQGITYPDGSVSTFEPGFFGVGIPSPGTRSYVFGVAAEGGVFIGAVGQVNDDQAGQQPYLFGKDSFQPLPRPPGAVNGGTAVAISGDGKIKIGAGSTAPGTGVYWDANNQVHTLPGEAPPFGTLAQAITLDGSIIAGDVPDEPGSDGVPVSEAALWTPGGTGVTRIGILQGFASSFANGISEKGTAVRGTSRSLTETAGCSLSRNS